MALSDNVVVNVSISNASSPTVQGLNTGLIAAYHNVYSDRVRVYSVATMLTQMIADGFTVKSPAYKAAVAYCAAPSAPALCCVGRRALPFTQTLKLTCVDGAVGDAYAFTVVGSDNVAHALAYTNVANPGPAIPAAALTGTVTVTKGSTTVTFSAAQTLTAGQLLSFSAQAGVSYTVAASTSASTTATLTTAYTGTTGAGGTTTPGATTSVTSGSTAVTFSVAQTLAIGSLLQFSSQPGVYYALSAAVTASTSGTLTTAYNGTTSAAAQTTTVTALAGTMGVTSGSASVTTTTTQVGTVSVGDSVQFTQQLGTYYVVAAVAAATLTLTTSYTGTTQATTYGADLCTASTAAAYLTYLLSQVTNIGTPTVSTNVITLTAVTGNLNDIQGWLSNGFASIQLQDVTADPGIATDLAAIRAANNGAFYGVILDSNSQLEVQAAEAWIEATGVGGKVGFFNNSDYQNTQSLVTTDLFSVSQLASYKRSFLQQNNSQLLCYAGAAACGQILAANAGSLALSYKSLPTVPADTDTTLTEGQLLALNSMTASTPGVGGKNGNFYKQLAGQNWLLWGCAPSGQFFDLTIGIDFLQTRMQANVAAAIAGLPKLPMTDIGIGAIKDAIDGTLRLMSNPSTYNFILADGQDPNRPIKVTVPTAASLTSVQRAQRAVPGITFSAGITGAIDTVVVTGAVIP